MGHDLKSFLRNPGTSFFQGDGRRKFYKMLSAPLVGIQSLGQSRLWSSLPPVDPDWKIRREDGFRTILPSKALALPSVAPVLKKCDQILASGTQSQSKGKSYLRQLLTDPAEERSPEFFELALDPKLLSAVADYLGELPVLTSIKLLHSVSSDAVLDGSQFYHCDHDDLRQVKLFLHVRDVDSDSGPLHVIPASLSERVRRKLGYSYGRKGHIPDEEVRDEEVLARETEITGARGTLSLVDTSQCFHFGSRVATKDRYVFYLQYVTRSSFIFHPLAPLLPGAISEKLTHFPYAGVALPGKTPLQSAVLGE